jgi:hypothetical protein
MGGASAPPVPKVTTLNSDERSPEDWARTVGTYSKAETTNPKDILGLQKVNLSVVPAVAQLHCAHAMMNGAEKYGPYNWRSKAVRASIYHAACKRHLDAWFDSQEEVASDSGVHHLGHAMACLAILLDAMETGNLVDDRPAQGAFARVLERLNATIKERKAA